MVQARFLVDSGRPGVLSFARIRSWERQNLVLSYNQRIEKRAMGRKKFVNIQMTADLWAKVRAQAAAEERSASAFVRLALVERLERIVGGGKVI